MRNPDAAWETVPPELAGETKNFMAGSASEAQSLARSLSPRDRERALATADRLQGAWRTPVLEPLVSAWAAAEPRAAIEWVAQNDNRSGVALAALGPWLVSDSAAAVAWADGTAPPELRQALGVQLARALAADEADRQKPMGYASLFRSASAEDKAISEALLQHSPATAARWIAEMPGTQSAGTAFKPIFENWLDRDATSAAQWIEALPASRRRDEATAAFATAAAARDVQSAAHWVPTIADQALRQNAAESVFRALDARDPAAARSWLRTVADLDEQWLERTLKPR